MKRKKKMAFGGTADPLAEYFAIKNQRRSENPTFIESPDTALMDNQIRQTRAQLASDSNPWLQGLDMLGSLAIQYGTNKMMGALDKKAFGGTINSPVEVEGDEVASLPNGNVIDFQGPTHEQGGIDTLLPTGSEVFADRIKVDGVSMADRKKKRVNKSVKLEDLLAKNPTDALLKNTIDRTGQVHEAEEAFDIGIQDTVNAVLNPNKNKFATGGPVIGTGPGDGRSVFYSDGNLLNSLINLTGLPQLFSQDYYTQTLANQTKSPAPVARQRATPVTPKTVTTKKATKPLAREQVNKIMPVTKEPFGLPFIQNGGTDIRQFIVPGALNPVTDASVIQDASPVISDDPTSTISPVKKVGGSGTPRVSSVGGRPASRKSPTKVASTPLADIIQQVLPLAKGMQGSGIDLNTNPSVPTTMNGNITLPGTNLEANNPTTGASEEGSFNPAFLPTMGDALGIFGNLYQAFEPRSLTLQNRATDTPNVNSMADYGKRGLKTLDSTKDYITQIRDENLKDLDLARTASVTRNRNSARGVGTMRALDLSTDAALNNNLGDIYSAFANQMTNILSQQAQLQNQQDQVVMGGEAQRDLADRQDRDNFYTQLSRDEAAVGEGISRTGKSINEIQSRGVNSNLFNLLNDYLDTNIMTGEISQKKDINLTGKGATEQLNSFTKSKAYKSLGYTDKTWNALSKTKQLQELMKVSGTPVVTPKSKKRK